MFIDRRHVGNDPASVAFDEKRFQYHFAFDSMTPPAAGHDDSATASGFASQGTVFATIGRPLLDEV